MLMETYVAVSMYKNKVDIQSWLYFPLDLEAIIMSQGLAGALN